MSRKNKLENGIERLFSSSKPSVTNDEPDVLPISGIPPAEPIASVQPAPVSEKKAVEVKPPRPRVKKPTPKTETTQPQPPADLPVEKNTIADEPSMTPAAPPTLIMETIPEKTAVEEAAVKVMPAAEKAIEPPATDMKVPANQSPAVENQASAPAVEPKAGQTEEDETAALIGDLKYADDEHLVVFRLNEQVYGVSIMVVESIIKNQAITPVPRAPFSIVGVTNLRGIVLPVINMHQRLGLEELENSPHSRIIIINKSDISAGLMVDEVLAVAKIDASSITPPSPVIYKTQTQFIKGIAKFDNRLVILLDLDKIFESIANRTGSESMKRTEKL